MILKSLIETLAPAECWLCGREGNLLCDGCLPAVIVTKRPTCFRCNRLSDGGKTCRSCRSSSALSGVMVASHYDGRVVELIQALKYRHARSASELAARLITPLLLEQKQFDLITSVPAAPTRYRQRGFNQSELIAKSVAAELALPYRSLLGRIGNFDQVGHSKQQRLKQADGAYYLTKNIDLSGQRILIIDDVLTTGATLNECAKCLKQAGAQAVWGAVVAKH